MRRRTSDRTQPREVVAESVRRATLGVHSPFVLAACLLSMRTLRVPCVHCFIVDGHVYLMVVVEQGRRPGRWPGHGSCGHGCGCCCSGCCCWRPARARRSPRRPWATAVPKVLLCCKLRRRRRLRKEERRRRGGRGGRGKEEWKQDDQEEWEQHELGKEEGKHWQQ